MTREREGLLLCLASAAGFGAMAIFAKQAYAAGLEVSTLLALRFVLAAALLWAIVALRREPLGPLRAMLTAGALGLLGYSIQAAVFFLALTRIEAGLASLLLYAYPALVTVAAIALRRERADRRRVGALAVATSGVALVLVGGGLSGDAVDVAGALLALCSGVMYTIFILTSDRVARETPALAFSAAVCAGCAITFVGSALILGDLGPADVTGEGLLWAIALAIFSTVLPIATFLAGLARVGPSTASILSTIEPPITVLLAYLVLSETLGAVQLAGGALVLSAVVLLQWGRGETQSGRSAAGSSRSAARPVA